MKVFKTKAQVTNELSALKTNNSLGFVPTMGALHQGHLSLIKHSQEQCDLTLVSIFVNQRQFNNSTDFTKYPRTLEEDLQKLEEIGVDFVFCPESNSEVYPDDFTPIPLDLNGIDLKLEGEFRPGHFQGVIDVIYQFFKILNPTKAFFGVKDYQQYRIIELLARKYFTNIEVIGIETERETSGLAMSSRNKRLSPNGVDKAKALHEKMESLNHTEPKEIISKLANAKQELEQNGFEVEYLEIVNSTDLQPVTNIKAEGEYRVFVAAHLEGVRLIDNIPLKL